MGDRGRVCLLLCCYGCGVGVECTNSFSLGVDLAQCLGFAVRSILDTKTIRTFQQSVDISLYTQ